MDIKIIKESGYEEAALGFSLSYNSTPERAKQILPKFAFGKPGENKFLESIIVWMDIKAPRFWWQEFDTYRVGVTKQSESTMHTISKRELTKDDFDGETDSEVIEIINDLIFNIKQPIDIDLKRGWFLTIKASLPEGFLQRRIVCTNYKTLQNIYNQRWNHRLPHWHQFCSFLLTNLQHPEFIYVNYLYDKEAGKVLQKFAEDFEKKKGE